MTHAIVVATIFSLGISVLPARAADEEPARTGSDATAAVAAKRLLSRPVVLPALYAGYAALQVYDLSSTRHALAGDAREANPLMRSVVGNTAAFVTFKTATTIGTVFAAERLWRTNRVAAIAFMAISNGVIATVAAHNTHTLRQLR